MDKELEMVKAFHEKFHALISEKPTLIAKDRSDNRFVLMSEEIKEYREGVESEDLVNIAKELTDILYTVYGTILEHGLQDVMSDVFAEVHESNMSKEYREYKMHKGPHYFKANVKQFFEEN